MKSNEAEKIFIHKCQLINHYIRRFCSTFQVNMAMAVLYARHVLMSLLADWPADGQVITAQLIGCQDDSHVPFILDLLNRSDTQETFQKVRHGPPSRRTQV